MESSTTIEVLSENKNMKQKIMDVVVNHRPESSFFLVDIDDLIQKCKTWKHLMPRVLPHYAVKCNDHPVVLKTLAALGLGFDCASKIEIQKVLSIGVKPERIIFAHPVKPIHHIQYASKVGVDLMTFDNEIELYKIKKLYPSSRLVIRIRYDSKSKISFGLKFGCDAAKEAPKLLQLAQNLGLNVIGASFHVGWMNDDPSAYYRAIVASKSVFDVAKSLGINFQLLDIGGGYPGTNDFSLVKHAETINSALDKYFSDRSIRVISEPGTYFVDSAFTLACNIVSVRKLEDDGHTKFMYYLNDGVFGSLSGVISVQQIRIPEPLEEISCKKYPSIVWGPTCDSTDLITKDAMLPELKFNDWVIFPNCGAYSLTICAPFNGIDPPKVFPKISKDSWLSLKHQFPLKEKYFVLEVENTKYKEKGRFSYDLPEEFIVRG